MTDSYIDIETIAATNFYAVKRVVRVKDQAEFARKELCMNTETHISRFQNEVRLLAKLNHPNLIRVIDQQLTEFPYYVITPLYKENLRMWLRQSPLSSVSREGDIRNIFDHIIAAIEYAHEQGVIHRDLKPENVLLNSPTELVIIDLNISVIRDEQVKRQTETGESLGTAHYIAPEQLRNAKCADFRSDIFSLGVILYELYGGKVGSSKLATDALPSLIRRIVLRCVEENPEKRYQSVADLKRAWRLACDANNKQSEVNEIEAAMLNWSPSVDNVIESARLIELLESYAEDVDLLDKFFMESEAEVLQRLAIFDEHRFDDLLKIWTEFFAGQQWPFDYTDKIARRCVQIWEFLESGNSKALIVCSMILMGNRHNRFFVWREAGQLIEHTVQQEHENALREFLFVMDEGDIARIKEYINKQSLKPGLKMIIYR
jgi:eukaryotic-like serine/threonine-protein kinase